MKENKTNSVKANNSNLNANMENVPNNLPEVEVADNTTTKGKVSGKFTAVDDAIATEAIENIPKNEVFAEVSDYFCPVKFVPESDPVLSLLIPYIISDKNPSGTITEEAFATMRETRKKAYLLEHSKEIEESNKLSFTEVLAKLQENKTLYNKVLKVCKVSELKESNYISNGKVSIYRASQCMDKEGNNRYVECTLTAKENGVIFSSPLFVEYREVSTSNIILAIRYYSSKQDSEKRLFNQISDYRRILTNVADAIKKAKENGFSRAQVESKLNEIFG